MVQAESPGTQTAAEALSGGPIVAPSAAVIDSSSTDKLLETDKLLGKSGNQEPATARPAGDAERLLTYAPTLPITAGFERSARRLLTYADAFCHYPCHDWSCNRLPYGEVSVPSCAAEYLLGSLSSCYPSWVPAMC